MAGGWRCIKSHGSGLIHVYPLDDLKGHDTVAECWCKPVNDEGIMVHNSMDGREAYEKGERRPH